MFIQVIEGKVSDIDAVHRQLEVWERDLQPGAVGYLGSTGGCTSTGDCMLIARFESREAARRNSDRPEQTRWWKATERLFVGPVRFHDTEDVHLMRHGDIDHSHFVQVMEGHVTNRTRADEMEREADPMLAELRPDLLGVVTAYFDDGEFANIAYFADEHAARAGERKEMPDNAIEQMAEWERVMKVERYLDIADPWLTTA